MKIKETIERDCCQYRDLKVVEGCEKINFNIPTLKFCIHCGSRWEYHSYIDEAGSRDWDYRKQESK